MLRLTQEIFGGDDPERRRGETGKIISR